MLFFTNKSKPNYKIAFNTKWYSRNASQFKGLPFNITNSEATKILTENRKLLERSNNNESKDIIPIDYNTTFKECFIPFHSADISNVSSSFSGKYGIDRIEWYPVIINGKLKMQTRIVTDWYLMSGKLSFTDYPLGTHGTQIYAGFEYPKDKIKSIFISDKVANIAQLNNNMLHDEKKKRREIQPHDMTISYAIEKIVGAIHSYETSRAEYMTLKKYNADRCRIENLIIHLEDADIKLKSYHLPAFIYTYTENECKLHKFVNGHTGEYEGEHVLSPIKLFFLGGLLGASAVPFLAAGTMMTGAALAGRMVLGYMATGIPSAVFARYKHVFRNSSINRDKREYIEHNKSYQETEDDINRRNDALNFNSNGRMRNRNTSESNGERIRVFDEEIKQKLIMLGLNPDVLPTNEELKTQYYSMIKKWHPDSYAGDKEVATAMTKQINEAYTTIKTFLC